MDERRLSSSAHAGQRLFDEAAVARRFQRRLREVSPPVRPAMQFDESGYPIEPQTGLAARVRRLITG